MGGLLGAHERVFIGPVVAEVAIDETATRGQMITSLKHDAPAVLEARFGQDCHVLQGDATVTATTSSQLFKKGERRLLVVTGEEDNYLSAIVVDSGTTGSGSLGVQVGLMSKVAEAPE